MDGKSDDDVYTVPHNFSPTAPVFDPRTQNRRGMRVGFVVNPQTAELCATLNIPDKLAEKYGPKQASVGAGAGHDVKTEVENPDEIDLDDL